MRFLTIPFDKLKKRMPAFKHWLAGCGAEVLKETNQYELVRFRTGNCTSIIYTNLRQQLSYTGEAWDAISAFIDAKPWRAAPKKQRRAKTPVVMRSIRARDGDLCFFCQTIVTEQEESMEHLVPITCDGPNHISNLFLAHRHCNAKAGHLSAPEKIRVHVAAVLAQRDQMSVAA